jgi:acyl-CoA reductase-like NAD-dependent aldehyde dehydrogenase
MARLLLRWLIYAARPTELGSTFLLTLSFVGLQTRKGPNRAISDARNAFSGWSAIPFGRRKAILASLLNKIGDHADELCALLTAEQGGPLAQARWEIDLLTKTFGPALMEMAPRENEQDGQSIEQITKRYVPIGGDGVISLWNLPVIDSGLALEFSEEGFEDFSKLPIEPW